MRVFDCEDGVSGEHYLVLAPTMLDAKRKILAFLLRDLDSVVREQNKQFEDTVRRCRESGMTVGDIVTTRQECEREIRNLLVITEICAVSEDVYPIEI